MDALELSECLTSAAYPDLQSAIAAYENEMRQYASAAGQATLDSMVMLHSPNAVQKLASFFQSGEVPMEETHYAE